MKKRVVIARSNSINPDSRVEKEANALASKGYQVTLLAWDRSSDYKCKEDIKVLKDCKVKRVSFGAKAEFGAGIKSLRAFMKFQKRLYVWLKKHKSEYDIAHFCDYDTALVGNKAAKGKKVVFDIFDYRSHVVNNRFQKIFKVFENSIINNADATIICTEERRKQIKGTHPKRLVVIHNTPTPISLKKGTTNNSTIKVVYVGILQDYRLLKEIINVIEHMDGVELHIGGFGKYESYIKNEAEKHKNIKYYGKLTYQETLELENNCDVMTAIYDPTIPNHVYAAPNKFYEGLMLGKPLIMVKGTGMSSIVKKYNIGVLIEYSEMGFKKGLNELILRRGEWEEMSNVMKRLYLTRFSWEEMDNRLCALYRTLSL